MDLVAGWLLLSVAIGVVAGMRGRSGFGYFLLSLVLSPVVGFILAVGLPDRSAKKGVDDEAPNPLTHVRCPDCRELVRADARKCKHCGTALVPQDLQASVKAPAVPVAPIDPLAAKRARWAVLGLVGIVVVILLARAWATRDGDATNYAAGDKLVQHCEANREPMLAEAKRKLAAGQAQEALLYLEKCAEVAPHPDLVAVQDQARGLAPIDASAGVREVCRQTLLNQMRVPSDTDFGRFHEWTVVPNADGSFSVGARHSKGYHTCVIVMEGESFKVQSIKRMT